MASTSGSTAKTRPVNSIARFAPEVLAEAGLGDAVAVEILEAATSELLLVTRAAAGWMATGQGPVPLALGGRLLAEGSELRTRLDERLADDPIPFAVRTADGSPLDGALRLGLAGDHAAYTGLIHSWTPAGAIA